MVGVSFRRPKKTLLQTALREATRSVSGALFLLFEAGSPKEKADLRERFEVGVCSILIARNHLTLRQATNELKPVQQELLGTIQEKDAATPQLWEEQLARAGPTAPSTLLSWLDQGADYVSRRLRGEPEPPAVDWSRSEQLFRERVRDYRGELKVSMDHGELKVGDAARAPLKILGKYLQPADTYLSGWADGSVPTAARPSPIFGCASRLFRIDLEGARSEARRAAWLGGFSYLLEYYEDETLHFLGVRKLESLETRVTFGVEDFRPDMIARFRQLAKDLKVRQPSRLREIFKAQAQEVLRLADLTASNTSLQELIKHTSESLEELAESLTVKSLFGASRDTLKNSEQERANTVLEKLRADWEGAR